MPSNLKYKELYIKMYDAYDKPLRSLHENRCISVCPKGYTDISGVCKECNSQEFNCETCRNSLSKCTSCIQTNDKKYLLGVSCLEKCPVGTVKNDTGGRCEGCIDGCDVCKESNPLECITCTEGLLLQPDKSCQAVCSEGYAPNFRQTVCEKIQETTVIYFPLCIMAALAGIISIGGKYSSKNVSGQHRRLLSFYSMLGVIDVLAMWAQVLFTVIYALEIIWIISIPCVALLFNYIINYKYKKLWDIIDPPKPEDED